VTSVVAEPAPHVLTWNDIDDLTVGLARKVLRDGRPDVIVGILRGGIVPAVMLAHMTGLRTVRAVEVTHTVRDGVNAAKTAEASVANPGSLGSLAGLDVLVVDDVTGTGTTLLAARQLAVDAGAGQMRAATCVLNRANWVDRGQQPEQVLTYIGALYSGWVIFPWEN
jgi:hypoxanthine phosphoribosyltransferase